MEEDVGTRTREKEEERSSTVSDYYWHCEVQTWGRRRESSGWGGGIRTAVPRAGPADKTEEIGKTAETSLR